MTTSIILPLLTFLFPLPSVIAQKHLFRQMGLDLLKGCISLNTTSSYLGLKHFWLETSVRVFPERLVPHGWPGTYWYTKLALNGAHFRRLQRTLIKNVLNVATCHHLHTRISSSGVRSTFSKSDWKGKSEKKKKKKRKHQPLVWWISPKSEYTSKCCIAGSFFLL